ncbi:putative toxin-antitoxin system toxin component, PIN family [Candidatus Woesearchaeota archaeon]|nr:putative toxin-antitoxin system toxin component, PIN family [Candidatus Woesearchaeota archaeon]
MQHEKPKVVFDTNIVVSAAISIDGNPARVFELFLEGYLVNYTSSDIIREVKDVLSREHLQQYLSEEFKEFMVKNFEMLSVVIEPTSFEDAIKEDPKDNKFIDCALAAKADIISGDRHLLRIKHYKGIGIISAREFLERYW